MTATPARAPTPGDAAIGTPEAMEARMRARRTVMRLHLALAADGISERTRHWPLWLVGSVAAAGVALALVRGRRGTSTSGPASFTQASPGVRLLAFAGWAMRLAPFVRTLLGRRDEHATRTNLR